MRHPETVLMANPNFIILDEPTNEVINDKYFKYDENIYQNIHGIKRKDLL